MRYTAACAAAVAALLPCGTDAIADFRIGMRALVLSTDSVVADLPRKVLQAHGVPFDILPLTEETVLGSGGVNRTALDIGAFREHLYEADGTPKYNAIVLTSNDLGYGYYSSDGKRYNWVQSVLSELQRQELHAYRATYGVRAVIMSSSATADPALAPALDPLAPGTVAYAEARFNQASSVAAAAHNSVPLEAVIQLGKEHEFLGNTYWTVPVKLADPRAAHIDPFLLIDFPHNATMPQGSIGAFVRRAEAKRQYEEMHFMFNANNFGLHGAVLGNVWLPWVTKGVYLGERRIMLSTQIDDMFLDTSVYNTTLDRQALENEEEGAYPFTYRVNANDLEFARHHQADLNDRLGGGSNYTTEMAPNSRGYYDFGNVTEYEPNVNDFFHEHRDSFLWLPHTMNHIDMYCIESNCTTPAVPFDSRILDACLPYDPRKPECQFPYNPKTGMDDPIYPVSGFSPKALIDYELERDLYFLNNLLFADVDRAELSNFPTYSQSSIVTPRISGLNYTEAIHAMLQAGIRDAVGDNSRDDLRPENEFHAFLASAKVGPNGGKLPANFGDEMEEKFGQRSIMVIPRWATRVYYDVSLPLENEMEHNSFYGPRCHGWNKEGPIVFGGLKCNTTSFKYPRNLTIDDMMAVEGFETARNLLAYVHHPYMFHQANLRTFEHGEEKATHSLLSLWLEAVGAWLQRYSILPVYTLKQGDLAKHFRARMARDACDIRAEMRVEAGRVKAIDVRTGGARCHAKLTVTDTDGGVKLQQRDGMDVVQYGIDTTFDIPVGEDAISLPAAGNFVPFPPAIVTSTVHTTATATATSTAQVTATHTVTHTCTDDAHVTSESLTATPTGPPTNAATTTYTPALAFLPMLTIAMASALFMW